MIADHGPHQRIWEALVDFAVAHATGTCAAGTAPTGHKCPESAELSDAQMALLEAGHMHAANGLLRWTADRNLETLRINARSRGYTATALAFKQRACADLLAAAVREDEDALRQVLADVVPDGQRLGWVLFELTSTLAAALIVRHQQLASEVPA